MFSSRRREPGTRSTTWLRGSAESPQRAARPARSSNRIVTAIERIARLSAS
jgi:hypothetical protein